MHLTRCWAGSWAPAGRVSSCSWTCISHAVGRQLDGKGRTALAAAVCKGRRIDVLLAHDRVDPNMASPVSGWGPLHLSLLRRQPAALSALLASQRLSASLVDHAGASVVHLLAFAAGPAAAAAAAAAADSRHGRELDAPAVHAYQLAAAVWWAARLDAAVVAGCVCRLDDPFAWEPAVDALRRSRHWLALHALLSDLPLLDKVPCVCARARAYICVCLCVL